VVSRNFPRGIATGSESKRPSAHSFKDDHCPEGTKVKKRCQLDRGKDIINLKFFGGVYLLSRKDHTKECAAGQKGEKRNEEEMGKSGRKIERKRQHWGERGIQMAKRSGSPKERGDRRKEGDRERKVNSRKRQKLSTGRRKLSWKNGTGGRVT